MLLIGDLFYEKELAERIDSHTGRAPQARREVLPAIPRSFFPVDRFEKVAEYSVPVTRALEDS